METTHCHPDGSDTPFPSRPEWPTPTVTTDTNRVWERHLNEWFYRVEIETDRTDTFNVYVTVNGQHAALYTMTFDEAESVVGWAMRRFIL
jgi:hypothetical protein